MNTTTLTLSYESADRIIREVPDATTRPSLGFAGCDEVTLPIDAFDLLPEIAGHCTACGHIHILCPDARVCGPGSETVVIEASAEEIAAFTTYAEATSTSYTVEGDHLIARRMDWYGFTTSKLYVREVLQ